MRHIFRISLFILLISVQAQAEEKTPVMFENSNMMTPSNGEPWVAPNYNAQESALGYEPGAFAIPTKMEERVSFWIDIYTKYNTDQGLLHDSYYVHLVYEVVDFTDIMKNPALNDYQKRKARERLVKQEKKKVIDRLNRLSRLLSPAGLEGDDLRYWYLFAKVDEKNKFKQATHRSRLRFQLGQSDRFLNGIYQSGKYIKKMEAIFKDRSLPIELTRLPFVESSFNYKARSHVGASGIWQFMRYTAKDYMKMN